MKDAPHVRIAYSVGRLDRALRRRMGAVTARHGLTVAQYTALSVLEARGRLLAVITQNTDGLHQAAGSKNVYELHGSVHRNYCNGCRKTYDISAISQATGIPRCHCGGVIRPDVVLFEESLNYDVIRQAETALRAADLLIVGGTSLVVYPAAGMITLSKCPLILLNKGETGHDSRASLIIRESIGHVLGQIKVN